MNVVLLRGEFLAQNRAVEQSQVFKISFIVVTSAYVLAGMSFVFKVQGAAITLAGFGTLTSVFRLHDAWSLRRKLGAKN